MNTSISPKFVLILASILSFISVQAQSNIKTTILYNSKLVTAEVTQNGEIVKILDDSENDLTGYTLSNADFTGKTTDLFDAKDKYSSFIPFEERKATLSSSSTNKLDKIVRKLNNDKSIYVSIQTLSIPETQNVNKNRADAVIMYFKHKGVEASRLSVTPLNGDKEVNEVKVILTKSDLKI